LRDAGFKDVSTTPVRFSSLALTRKTDAVELRKRRRKVESKLLEVSPEIGYKNGSIKQLLYLKNTS
jgi:hypothetical protein